MHVMFILKVFNLFHWTVGQLNQNKRSEIVLRLLRRLISRFFSFGESCGCRKDAQPDADSSRYEGLVCSTGQAGTASAYVWSSLYV